MLVGMQRVELHGMLANGRDTTVQHSARTCQPTRVHSRLSTVTRTHCSRALHQPTCEEPCMKH